ncbi:MAG: hypothetical protein ACI9N0_002033 [Ilumatobacter sp.]|jgi:hypothetical protein
MFKTRAAVVAAAMLMFSACGSSDEEVDTTNPGNDAPAVAGACIEGVVDCDDTAVIDDSEGPGVDAGVDADADADAGADGGVVMDGAVVEGGLTIDEALASDATGIVAVRGFLFDDGSGLRLCSVLAESFPPQCGGALLTVEGFDFDRMIEVPEYELVQVENSGGVRWSDGHVTLFGEVVNGNLVIEGLNAG